MSIRWKLTVWYAIIVSLVLASLGTFIYLTLRRSVEQDHIAFDKRLARTMADIVRLEPTQASERPEWGQDIDFSDEDLVRQLRGRDVYLQLTDPHGATTSEAPPPFKIPVISNSAVKRSWIDRRENHYMIVVNVPVRRGGVWIGSVQVFERLGDLEDFMERVRTLMLLGMLLGVAVALGGGIFMAWVAFKPVSSLVAEVDLIGPYDLNRRIDPRPVPAELRGLVATFNDLLNRLEISFSRQRQLVADASHELRTPVTSILGHAGLLDRWGKADRKVLDESIIYIQKDARRMESIVGDLLTLAKSDSSELPSATVVPLADVVAEAVEDIRILAGKRTVILTSEQVSVRVDGESLRRMVSELLYNSIKFTQPTGTVEVTVVKNESSGVVLVRDDGEGISPEDLPRIFERFYRVDKARSRKTEGTGLGLSIVQSLAESYGGKVTVSSQPGRGSCFRLELPLAGDE